MVWHKSKQRGIGLLELMLTMVIIAIVTMMSVQYFGASKRNTLTTKGVNEIQAMVSTVAGMPNPPRNDSVNLTDAVAMSGQIPAEYIYQDGHNYIIATPWSTVGSNDITGRFFAIIVNAGSRISGNPLVLRIYSQDLPNWACQSLVDRFQASAKAASCEAHTNSDGDVDDDNELLLDFPLTMTDDL